MSPSLYKNSSETGVKNEIASVEPLTLAGCVPIITSLQTELLTHLPCFMLRLPYVLSGKVEYRWCGAGGGDRNWRPGVASDNCPAFLLLSVGVTSSVSAQRFEVRDSSLL